MATRILLGLTVGSAADAADAVAIRAEGFGWDMRPTPFGHYRVPLTNRSISESASDLAQSVRQLAARGNFDLRTVLAVGLWEPDEAADAVAELTGLTVVTGFPARDAAAGGLGHLLTPAADFLLFHSPSEDRVLIHLGSVSNLVFLPGGGKVADLIGFDAGPGTSLLDDITSLGTRGKESYDPGGTKAVQGKCLDDLLAGWMKHPHFVRKPPKAVPWPGFADKFLTRAFDATRASGGSLNDLLCTATHFIARGVGDACWRWIPEVKDGTPRRYLASGGGARNGFLWKLLEREFPGTTVERLDALGVPATGRTAAAAAVLAGLALDGVAGNLPLVTGAVGGRVCGRIVPGDARNWAAATAWAARQAAPYRNQPRAA